MGLHPFLKTILKKDPKLKKADLPQVKMELFYLLISTVLTLTAAAPEGQRAIRAAPEYERVCEASAEAYSKAKSAGKPSKIAGMVKYFNTATSNDLNVVTPICKAATVAYFNAKIAGKTPDEAKLAAAGAYVPLLLKDFGADPGEACIKSQDYISN